MGFTPFSTKDFDAYLQNKWESHVFNRERLEVREKLEALGKLLNPSLVGGDGAPLECEVSTEHPALWNQRKVQNQHLFFSRNKEARKEIEGIISRKRSMAALIEDPSPLRNHIFLAVMIDKDQVELSLKLHSDAAVDRDNLQRKCQEYFHREKLVNLVQDLPQGYSLGIYGRPERATTEIDDDALQALIQELPSSGSWLTVRRTLSRDDPVVVEAGFVDVARDGLSHLLPIHNFIAWSRENDFVSMRDTLKKKEAKTRSKGLSKNDRVRVVRGMFSGKTGVVQGTDAKGGLKVLLGSMMVKLTGEDVVKI
jgi:transcription antitermination factor NusG